MEKSLSIDCVNPLISIIIPTYNRGHIIGETLDSILRQTYQNWECLIIDDNSEDNTPEAIGKFLKEDSRFHFHVKPKDMPQGPSSSRNLGIKLSKGEYINFMDSDDLMVEDKLQRDIDSLIDTSYDFTISQSIFFGDGLTEKKIWNQRLYSDCPLDDFIQSKIGWGMNSSLWRKSSILEKELKFNENLRSGNDYFFHIEAIQKGFKPIIIDEVLVYIRDHDNQIKHLKQKADYKLEIFYTILSEGRFKISSATEKFLIEESVKQIKSAFRHKNTRTANKYFRKIYIIPQHSSFRIQLLKTYIFGYFYFFTSRGYSWI